VQVAEVEYVCKDGSTRWAEIRVSALRDAQGQPTALLGVTRDIAERRRAEEELRKYREHLEELVAERTHALEQAQEVLLRKERLAAVGQLAGSIAHEIRNPLGIIRNAIYFLETAARDQLADKPARYLTIIRQEVERTEQIVSSLLDYARARAPNRARCALADIVAAALDRAAPPPGVVVESSLPPDLPRVIVDSAQLVQSLLNLVTNAVQAMDQQGRLHIRARVAPEGVELSIADSGPGISAADLPRVFEPLFSTRSLGTGLGLAITRAFVEANGGHINVRSEPGQGAEFTLVLPAAAD
jgi:signal transduction histidine kinase